MLRALAFVLFSIVCAPTFGQIFYEPVQYQYHYGNQVFYYGGTDPSIIAYGYHEAAVQSLGGYNRFGRPFLIHAPVYSDLLPYRDMTAYGYTAADAANEANANVPRYFRKADLLRSAIPQSDGTWVVPAKASPVYDTRPIVSRYSRALPAPRKGEIIIIPKNLLDRPLKSFLPRDKQVASSD